MFLLFAGFNCFNLYFLPIGGCCLFAYIYMYCMGRLQHHVDVTVLIAGAILLFYYCIPIQKAEIFSLKQCCLSLGILIIIFVGVNFDGLSHSSYYGLSYGSGKSQREEYEKNKENLELISEDTEHLYLVGAYSTTYICNREWTIFDVVKPGIIIILYLRIYIIFRMYMKEWLIIMWIICIRRWLTATYYMLFL